MTRSSCSTQSCEAEVLIGLLGGTFDPVHLGHVEVARQARSLLGLDRVLLVPAFQPPHRPPPAAVPEDRLAMARLAVENEPGLVVDDIEIRRRGISYTVETLREVSRREPREDLVLLLGRDAALEFGSWRDGKAIAALATLAVVNRSGLEAGAGATLPAGAIDLVIDSPEISATAVRDALAAGADPSGMLAPSVTSYIREHRLYGAGGGGRPRALS
ncbi:MAG: nicotinate (nicotinamide) nucleotide adenylyltransferase [Candidatus Dormibacteria bacterium]